MFDFDSKIIFTANIPFKIQYINVKRMGNFFEKSIDTHQTPSKPRFLQRKAVLPLKPRQIIGKRQLDILHKEKKAIGQRRTI